MSQLTTAVKTNPPGNQQAFGGSRVFIDDVAMPLLIGSGGQGDPNLTIQQVQTPEIGIPHNDRDLMYSLGPAPKSGSRPI